MKDHEMLEPGVIPSGEEAETLFAAKELWQEAAEQAEHAKNEAAEENAAVITPASETQENEAADETAPPWEDRDAADETAPPWEDHNAVNEAQAPWEDRDAADETAPPWEDHDAVNEAQAPWEDRDAADEAASPWEDRDTADTAPQENDGMHEAFPDEASGQADQAAESAAEEMTAGEELEIDEAEMETPADEEAANGETTDEKPVEESVEEPIDREQEQEEPAQEEPKKDPLTVEKSAAVKNDRKKLILAGIAILLEVGLLLVLSLTRLNRYALVIEVVMRVLAVLIVLGIYSQYKSSTVKIPWIMLIIAAPVLGILLYLFIGLSGSTRRLRKRYERTETKLVPYLQQDPTAMYNLRTRNAGAANIAYYLHKYVYYPVYQNTDVDYFEDAAIALEAQKAALRNARKFIFMEYHVIEDAESWKEIQEILEEKARQGVEVRVFYDDLRNIGFKSTAFEKRLQEAGIACRAFTHMIPLVNLFLNNRDHRRLTVVDGEVGFTGGYNMANEYFHVTQPYGHWKDTGLRLRGKAVDALTITFLTMWNTARETDKNNTDFQKYLFEAAYMPADNGFVQPYADTPMNEIQVGEDVCMSMIEQARSYVYIMTPRLIISDEMSRALCLAARRGVDVRIITPGIPDRKLIHRLSRSYYANLAVDGVRIFEYAPGFCHARMCVSDDIIAACGAISFDFRSLYHHFENGCFMAECKAVADMKADFERTFALCEEVSEEYSDGRSVMQRFGQLILRLIAPLL